MGLGSYAVDMGRGRGLNGMGMGGKKRVRSEQGGVEHAPPQAVSTAVAQLSPKS